MGLRRLKVCYVLLWNGEWSRLSRFWRKLILYCDFILICIYFQIAEQYRVATCIFLYANGKDAVKYFCGMVDFDDDNYVTCVLIF